VAYVEEERRTMAVAYKVAMGQMSSRRATKSDVDSWPPDNPWQPHKIRFFPRAINGRMYWPGDIVYRRWALSPGGGFWQYGDEFDYLKWQP
jgi:hypothetical protein